MSPSRWPPWEVESSRQVLLQLRDHITRGIKPEQPHELKLPSETLSWLARLLVVRSCGHLEQVVKECSKAYVAQRSGGPVQSFALSWMERSRNPSRENLVALLERFDPVWATDFVSFLVADDELLHRDLAWAVDTRNRIAHGENQGASVDKALATCASLQNIADWWISKVDPTR